MCLMDENVSVRATDLLSAFFTVRLFVCDIERVGSWWELAIYLV